MKSQIYDLRSRIAVIVLSERAQGIEVASKRVCSGVAIRVSAVVLRRSQERKGARWMPWHLEPMKGVASNERLRIAASKLTRRYPNGATQQE